MKSRTFEGPTNWLSNPMLHVNKNGSNPVEIVLPMFTLKNNKWERGGEWSEDSRLIALYDYNDKNQMVRIGTGIY